MIDILPPPPVYNHPFPGRLHVLTDTAAETDRRCRLLGNYRLACMAKVGDHDCLIFAPIVGPGGVGFLTFLVVLTHEVAHCNGWPANHKRD